MTSTEPIPLGGLGRPPRIVVVKTSALGDVVHALPTYEALREGFPEARIAWVVEEPFAPVLAGLPGLDRILPVRLRRWRRTPFARDTRHAFGSFLRELRAFRADVALDLMGNHKSGALCRLAGARWRVGARRRARREPSSAIWINRPIAVEAGHAVQEMASLLAAFGLAVEEPAYDPSHVGTPDAPAPALPEPYALIQPGAGWGNKRYPAGRWGAVASALHEHHGLAVGILAGPGEEALASEVAEASGGLARPLGDEGLEGLIGALRGARIVLGGDTGPVHLAHGMGRPVVMVHGPTDPERHGPWRAPDRALWNRLPCSFCHRRLEGTKACLLQVSIDRVLDRAAALLESGTSTRSTD